jgi:hypothetical protein
MPPKRTFDAELNALESLREATPAAAEPKLAHALTLANNFLVAKAATLAQHHNLQSLTPALVAALPRFFTDAAKSDPQCWAKNAIAKTLAAFEYQEPDPFLRGLHHHQLEPVWGGQQDTAGALRGTCALALVQCRTLSSHYVLTLLTPLFADKDIPVQVNAARAVEQIGTPSAELLLRLRAELASGEPELLGACYSGVLSLCGPSAIPWAAQFLPPADDAAAEAAFAIAQTRTEQAFTILREAQKSARDRDFRATLLTAIALTRQPAAIEYLLELVAEGSPAAREALEQSAPPPDILTRLKAIPRP